MRRRRPDLEDGVPRELARYVAAEWADPQAWYDAREAHRDAGGPVLPMLPGEELPDTPWDRGLL